MNPNRLLQNIRLGWSPLAVIAATTLATIAISVYCLFSGWFIIFQNLFYIPIIIACVFYARKGFAFSVALSFGYLLLIIAFTRDSAVIMQALIRVFIFVGVAGVTTFLSVKRKQIEEELKQHRENLEKLVKERTAELKQMVKEATRLRQQMELILGAAKTGLGIIDSELNIRYVNIEWQKVYGDPKGRKCYEYFMGRSDVCPDCGALKALATKQVIVTERVMPKEGNRPIQVTTIPFQDEEGDWLVVEVNVDITERKRAEDQLRLANRALRTISECNQLLIRATNEAMLLEGVCQLLVEHGGYRMAWVGFAERDEAKCVRPVAQAGFDAGYLETVNITWADVERGRGPTGMAIRTGQHVIARNVPTDPTYGPWREAAIKRGYASSIALPLRANGQTFGALNLYAAVSDAFSADEVAFLTELANDLAYGITVLHSRQARERAEQALRVISARQEAILDAVHDIIMEVDANKVYTWANQAGLEFFGEDVIGKEAASYFEGEQNTYQIVQPLFNGNEDMLYVESWQRRKDGRKRLLAWWCRVLKNDQGKVTGALSSARDITERYYAKVAIIESERKFRTLFSSMDEGVALHEMVYDDAGKAVDYRILDINPAYERHIGLSAERACGALASGLYDLGGPPNLQEFEQVAHGGEPITFEMFFPPLQKHFKISAFSPQPGQFATLFEDITERKRREAQLRLKTAELERFTYTISHDLKSPLVTIKTFLGYLEEDRLKADAGRVEKDLFYLHAAADKMGKLLDDLLEMSRIGRVVNSSVRVTFRELVDEALNVLAGCIAKRGVEVRVSDEELALFGDRQRLAEIWQNLIENAVKFMGAQASPRIEIGVEPAGRETVFFVRDNGMGIDPRYHGKIFGLFEKLDPKIEGTGLGLALVKQIVELNGGTIDIESKGAGHGASFRFTLPHAIMNQQEVESP